MFEEPESREKIKNIFKNIYSSEEDLIPKFRESIKTNEPIGLYVATKDQSDIMWVFGKEEIASMLGGDEELERLVNQLLPTEKDKREGILFAILKKVGPIYAIRLEKAILEEVFL